MTTLTASLSEPPVAARDLRALPKGHLHLHLEAAMRPHTLVELCREADVPVPATSGFSDFSEFSECYLSLLAVLRKPENLARLMDETFQDQAADGVVYVELG